MAALRGFLLSVVDCEVVQAQVNRVAMPAGPFVAMTNLGQTGLSTNRTTYHDTGVSGTGTENSSRTTQWTAQLDFYGAGAAERAALVAGLVRSEFACNALKGTPIQPLYAGEPHNTTLLNGEQQYEDRWTFDFVAQCNPIITTPMDFAAELHVGLAEIDATFPPGD